MVGHTKHTILKSHHGLWDIVMDEPLQTKTENAVMTHYKTGQIAKQTPEHHLYCHHDLNSQTDKSNAENLKSTESNIESAAFT